MGYSVGILLISLLVGSFAVPTPEANVDLFDHTNPSARIVGGTPAEDGSIPHMVLISLGVIVRSLVCGGSLISTRTVLTAAHCIDSVYSSSTGTLSSYLQGYVGTNNWMEGGSLILFARNVTHQHYVSSLIKNDIGVLITTTEVVFSERVQPISVSFEFLPGNVPVKVAGWGKTRHEGIISLPLLELSMLTVDGQQCVAEVARAAALANMVAPPVDPQLELCTYHDVDHGMCNGDSGSALFRVDQTGRPVDQVGIVSWGIPCARGAPDMFVRISSYRHWLIENAI